jgi:hypothetical protein
MHVNQNSINVSPEKNSSFFRRLGIDILGSKKIIIILDGSPTKNGISHMNKNSLSIDLNGNIDPRILNINHIGK